MKNRPVNIDDRIEIPVLLYVIAMVLLVLSVTTDAILSARAAQPYEGTPRVIYDFLEDYVTEIADYTTQEAVVEMHFSCVDKSTIDHDGCSQTLRDLGAVFMLQRDRVASYRVCYAQKDYIEIMLLDADGRDIPCRIGFFYQVDSDGKIARYAVTRLQPVDKSNREWSELWL